VVAEIRPKNTIRTSGFKIILTLITRGVITLIFAFNNLINQIKNIEIILQYQILKIVYQKIYN